MLTMRPSPADRMAVNAARQQRNEPVRFTPSVCCHISTVVSANRAEVSTAAAQTRAVGVPAAPWAAANRRSTSVAWLTPVTTATRPASQCPRSGTGLRSGGEPGPPPVQLLVRVQALLQVKVGLGMLAAGRARDLSRLGHGPCGRL